MAVKHPIHLFTRKSCNWIWSVSTRNKREGYIICKLSWSTIPSGVNLPMIIFLLQMFNIHLQGKRKTETHVHRQSITMSSKSHKHQTNSANSGGVMICWAAGMDRCYCPTSPGYFCLLNLSSKQSGDLCRKRNITQCLFKLCQNNTYPLSFNPNKFSCFIFFCLLFVSLPIWDTHTHTHTLSLPPLSTDFWQSCYHTCQHCH